MTNPYSPPNTARENSRRASRLPIASQVLARHSNEAGITCFTMMVLCASASALYSFAMFIQVMILLDAPIRLHRFEPLQGVAICFFCATLAFVATRLWWRENFRWAMGLSMILCIMTAIILESIL